MKERGKGILQGLESRLLTSICSQIFYRQIGVWLKINIKVYYDCSMVKLVLEEE